ncbi:MAG: hypothetical protein Q8Q82_20465 [Hydrogenophaga sp.]|nr:hypothetical protein [Hydrogenophaga sp.]
MEDSEKPRVPSSAGAAAKSTSLTPEQKAALAEALVKMAMDPGVQEMFRNIGRGIQSLIEAIRPYASFVGKMLYGLGEIMARLPVQLQTAVLALAARGWFYDHEADLSDYWKAEEMIRTGDVAAADVLMARHFESRLDAIESDLCVRLPHRASKIRNAVAAHRRQEFDLAIPALLAQADGVCKELRGGHFFLMDRTTRRPEADPYARANSNTVFNQVLHMALVEQIPLKQQMRKRSGAEARLLNRHAVMHGESLDFDTKENSLRALSLLNYVALALDDPDTEAPTRLMNTVVRSASFAVPAKKPLS